MIPLIWSKLPKKGKLIKTESRLEVTRWRRRNGDSLFMRAGFLFGEMKKFWVAMTVVQHCEYN